ncbi:MAG: RT0821/Lpp0805 family surface protein [Aestuariivirga sp.]|jgi:surface antigen
MALKSRENQIMLKTYAAVAMAGLMLAGCAPDSGPKESSGALLGGVAGGLLGNSIGHGNGRAAATILGAALGAVVGGKVGRSLDDEDRNYAYGAATRSFTSGREVTWENPDSGHRGRFRSRPGAQRDGRLCRDFDHTIWVDGEPELIEGTACQTEDGRWRVVG